MRVPSSHTPTSTKKNTIGLNRLAPAFYFYRDAWCYCIKNLNTAENYFLKAFLHVSQCTVHTYFTIFIIFGARANRKVLKQWNMNLSAAVHMYIMYVSVQLESVIASLNIQL